VRRKKHNWSVVKLERPTRNQASINLVERVTGSVDRLASAIEAMHVRSRDGTRACDLVVYVLGVLVDESLGVGFSGVIDFNLDVFASFDRSGELFFIGKVRFERSTNDMRAFFTPLITVRVA
jgi:hypothetical protein